MIRLAIVNDRRRDSRSLYESINNPTQTGTSANPGNIVQFVLADSTCLLDPQSVVFSANVQVNSTSATATMDDGPAYNKIWACIA